MKYKNLVLIVVSLILFAYAGFIGVMPIVISKTFNKAAFSEKMQKAAGINVTMDEIDVKISPNFETFVYATDLKAEFPDKQPILKAGYAELRTTPGTLLGNKIVIKKLIVNEVKYDDLILPDGVNKIAYIPGFFEPKFIGKRGLTIVSGPVEIRDINASFTKTKPYSYTEKRMPDIKMSEKETRDYLQSLNFKNVNIK